MKNILITGTDTGVGKTVITGLLARFLLSKKRRIVTQKWIQTGTKAFPEDILSHLLLMQKDKGYIKEYLPYVAPYIFRFPASPHLTTKLEKQKINVKKIKKSTTFLSKKFDLVLIEGSGGALVPFTEKKLILDIAEEMKLPVLVVVGNRLGAINHTLLTIEALKRRRMKIVGVVFNNQREKTKDIILKDNSRIVKKLTGEKVFGTLPRMKNKKRLYKKFIPIGEKIYRAINR